MKTLNELIGQKFIYVGCDSASNIPFNIIGRGDCDTYPLKVQTWEGRNYKNKLSGKTVSNFRLDSINEMISNNHLIAKISFKKRVNN